MFNVRRALVSVSDKRGLIPFVAGLAGLGIEILSPGGTCKQLRKAGLDDRAILDLAQCVGYFNYVNRIVAGLGVRLGEDEGTPGQWPE